MNSQQDKENLRRIVSLNTPEERMNELLALLETWADRIEKLERINLHFGNLSDDR